MTFCTSETQSSSSRLRNSKSLGLFLVVRKWKRNTCCSTAYSIPTMTILPLTLLKFSPGWRSLSHQVVTNTSREDREQGSARVGWPAVGVRSAPVPPSGAPSSSSWWNWAPYSCTPDDCPCWRLQPQRRGEKRAVREEEEEQTKCSLDGRFWTQVYWGASNRWTVNCVPPTDLEVNELECV